MPGKMKIKVASILLLIGGVLSFIVYVLMGGLLALGTIDTGIKEGWYAVAGMAAWAVAAVLMIIAAVKGLKGCTRRDCAGSLVKWGVVVLIISILSNWINLINSMASGESFASSILSAVIGLILPIVYIVGAKQNQKRDH